MTTGHETSVTLDAIERAADAVRARLAARPDVAIILGTGLGALGAQIRDAVSVPYDEIPGFQRPTVESHRGRMICGLLGGRPVVAMQGRFHRYEGYSLQQVTFPVRVMRALGADVVGMSTVPEVIVAVHGGMRVLGVSIITDLCLPDALEPASVERIIAVATDAEPRLSSLLAKVVERL
jgi:purine nucleoside phosphorylase